MHILKCAGLALALALPLAACATNPGGNCDTLCIAEKGLTTAYSAHDTLIQLAIANHASGALSDANYATVKGYLNTAKTYLDAAYLATDAVTIDADVAKANAQIANAQPLVKGN